MKERMKTCHKCKGEGYVTSKAIVAAKLVCATCGGRGKVPVGRRPGQR